MKRLIFLILTVANFSLYSQYSYYKEALITKNDNSILRGYIERISESNISKGLKFKETIENKNVQHIPVEDITNVVFVEDSVIFCKVRYTHYQDTSRITEHRLAKKILNGYAQLYKLQLPEEEQNIIFELTNTYVYIVKIDTNYYVLDQKEKLEGTNYRLYKNYIGVLTYLMRDHEDLKSQIKNLKFSDNQMISLFNNFNLKYNHVANDIVFKKEKRPIQHGPIASYATLNNFDNIKNSSGFEIGYSMRIFFPELSERISTDLACIYQLNYYTDNENIKYTKSWIKIPVSTTYHFTNTSLSPFLSIGFSNQIFSNYYDLYIKLATGITLFKNWDISFTVENSALKFDTGRILSLNLGYYFGTSNNKARQ